jgi:type II secretory pathway pseudopilin PulG
MNVQKPIHPRTRARGVTLVEILLVLGLLVIIAGFAVPSFGTASARAEMKVAIENLEYSIGTARNVARLTDSSVSLNIVEQAGAAGHKITFSQPAKNAGKNGPGIPDYLLPEGIGLVAEQDRFVFDPRGLVDHPGRIVLVSLADDAVTTAIEIN